MFAQPHPSSAANPNAIVDFMGRALAANPHAPTDCDTVSHAVKRSTNNCVHCIPAAAALHGCSPDEKVRTIHQSHEGHR